MTSLDRSATGIVIIRPPHHIQTVTDATYFYRCSMVCLCACLTLLSALKTVELTEVTFGTWPWVGPRNHVLGGAQIPPGEGTIFVGVHLCPLYSIGNVVQNVC